MATPADKIAFPSGSTVGQEELAARFHLEPNQRERIKRRLRKSGIPFVESRESVWTTVEAINRALGVSSTPEHKAPVKIVR